MSFLDAIVNIVSPVAKLIDEVHTSDEERLTIKRELFSMQAQMFTQALEYEKQLSAARADVIKAEANGQGWMQRTWRPITMLTFLVLVVCDSFGLLAFRLSEEAWTLLQIGLGGYVVGRSAEKILPAIKETAKGS